MKHALVTFTPLLLAPLAVLHAADAIRLTTGPRHTFKLKPFEVVVLDATPE